MSEDFTASHDSPDEGASGPPLQAIPVMPGDHEAQTQAQAQAADGSNDAIAEPGKLLRIASMVRELLEETRGAPLDEQGRTRLRQIYERSVDELRSVLPEELERELQEFILPLEGVPTESEMRVAQAQLVGWLEGLFHGIQAAIVAQQQAAMAQLQEIRRRGLPPGAPGAPGMGLPGGQPDREHQPGQYL
jgi:hypothetical protein